jgi:hypothetical protein
MNGAKIVDEYDFNKIDKEIEEDYRSRMKFLNKQVSKLPIDFPMSFEIFLKAPPRYEWIPIGEYDGADLPDTIVDENYIVWLKIECPEYNCEILQ